MSIHPFFRELKEAREAKGLSLAQISDITRISEHHLEALERGEVSLLPQAYVRAFLREYADLVGLKPDQVMQKYDAMLSGVSPHTAAAGAAPPPPPPPPPVRPAEEPPRERKVLSVPRTRWLLLAISAIAAGVVLWKLLGQHTPTTTEEIPFQSVLADKERRLAPAEEPHPGVMPASSPTADSLTLRGTTTDTVWVMVIIDQEPPKEYIFKPNIRFTMKAKDRFSVTLGNAGAVEFTLNQKKIGLLGKPGSVVRNVELTRATLKTP
jgi:cytoskeleton protein RodZ